VVEGALTIAGSQTLAIVSPGTVTNSGTITNNGTITTDTTSDTALAALLLVGGDIEATGAITTLNSDFTVPADVTLTLSGSSATFASGGKDLTVAGTLTLNGVTAFAPGNVSLDGGDLVVSSNSKIVISVSDVSGAGKIIAPSGEGAITVSGIDYTTTSSGIAGDDLDGAVTAISGETALTDGTVTLDSSLDGAGSQTAIGSVTLVTVDPAQVSETTDGSSGSAVEVASGISLAGTVISSTVGGVDTTDLTGGSNGFTLSLDGVTVQLADGDFAGSADKAGVVEFDAVQLQYGELIGPELTFHIGVKTKR
jgi:hypothetical protein